MSLLNELTEKKMAEESKAALKKQEVRMKEEAYLKNQVRIDEKLQAIESYIIEVNKVSKNRASISKPENYAITFDCGDHVSGRRMALVFQGDDVEIHCTDYMEQREDEIGELLVQIHEITNATIDSWVKFVMGYGKPPVKLKSLIGRRDAKVLKAVGLILLLIIGAFILYSKFLA
jgi:hypothetical protein